MQHIGDLEPLGRPDFFADHAPLGRYSARRSRWRFAVGSLVVGFDRASEQIEAEKRRPIEAGASPGAFGQRLMTLVGILSTATLSVAAAGWLWSTRGAILGTDQVAAPIAQYGRPTPGVERATGPVEPNVIPTPAKAKFSATIERQDPAPAVAPAPQAYVAIAQAPRITPRPAPPAAKDGPAPDEAIVASGNYLLIPAVGLAVSQAMVSGEAQSWEAGTYRGLVVVGDADPREGMICRQGTVLLRDGSSEGRTQRFERCV